MPRKKRSVEIKPSAAPPGPVDPNDPEAAEAAKPRRGRRAKAEAPALALT